jgi:hypothetical protein
MGGGSPPSRPCAASISKLAPRLINYGSPFCCTGEDGRGVASVQAPWAAGGVVGSGSSSNSAPPSPESGAGPFEVQYDYYGRPLDPQTMFEEGCVLLLLVHALKGTCN